MRKLLAWCERRGLDVTVGARTDCYYIGLHAIDIRRTTPRSMLVSLLHECGHYLCDRTRAQRWPRGYHALHTPVYRKGHRHNVACLSEEIEAWDRGERLARRLGIRHDLTYYRQCRDREIAGYARKC